MGKTDNRKAAKEPHCHQIILSVYTDRVIQQKELHGSRKEPKMKSSKELEPNELEKASGGSIHFPHITQGTYWHCYQCQREVFFKNGTSEEEKQRMINEHKTTYHGA